MLVGFHLKLLGGLARIVVAEVAYGGLADARMYMTTGNVIAQDLRSPTVAADLGERIVGTQFIRVVSGLVQAVIGPTTFGAFLVFTTFGFVGLFLLYRAAALAVPTLVRRRYAALLFLLPTHVYWPSSVGKEAWLTLTIGLTAYGVALLSIGGIQGVAPFLLGIAGTTMVRPHFALILIAGASAIAFPRLAARSRVPVLARSVAIGAVLLAAISVGPRFEEFFGVDLGDLSTSEDLLDDTTQRSEQGGSARSDAVNVLREPWRYPEAAVTVLLRPFPWEARNVVALLAALETVGLIALALRHRRTLRASLVSALSNTYLAFSAIYALGFVGAWGSVANFGILARQRTLVFPFVLLVLCLAPRPKTEAQASSRPRLARSTTRA
jgi:hypothetical protein